jgi:8-oxo-dGTP pyrophosphatase MutT (NUDIX family)
MPGVSFVLVKDDKVLMERRPADAKHFPGTLRVPGGKVNEGEMAWVVTLFREMREELGVEPVLQSQIAGTYYYKRHHPNNRVKAFLVQDWEPKALPDHVLDTGAPLEWVTWEQALEAPLGMDHKILVDARAELEYERERIQAIRRNPAAPVMTRAWDDPLLISPPLSARAAFRFVESRYPRQFVQDVHRYTVTLNSRGDPFSEPPPGTVEPMPDE